MTNLILGQDGIELILGIPVPAPATGESNTLADAGDNAHESLVATPAKVGDALQAKGLRAGTNVALTDVPADNVVEVSVPLPDKVEGPATATDSGIALFDGATGKLLKDSGVTIDGSGNIDTPGTVDGRNVSADGAVLDAHVANLANPHATTAAQVGADVAGAAAAVQSGLDAHVADLANPHVTTAAQVGADPTGTAAAAVSAHEATYAHANLPSANEKAALAGTGTPSGANPYVNNDDARLSDARVPTGAAGGDLAGTYPTPTVPHVTLTNNPHGVTVGQVGGIPASDKGNPNGVASLDGSGDVPIAQIPDSARPIVHQVADAAARIALGLGADDEGHEAIQADDSSQWLWTGTAWVARATAGSGDVTGPGASADNAIARYDGTTGKLIQDSAVTIDDAGNIATAGTVDGRDVSTDGAKLDGVAAGAQPNQNVVAGAGLSGGGAGATVNLAADIGVGAGQVAAGNDARFPTAPEKAALVGSSGSPSGANPYVTDADPRIPSSGENNALQGTFGTPGGANRYVTDTDPRMTDSRAPTAHGSTHEDGGSDEIGSHTPAANAIVKADAFSKVTSDWLNVGTGSADVAAGNDGRFPTNDQKAALVGVGGAPSGANPYVTNSDPRFAAISVDPAINPPPDVDKSAAAVGVVDRYAKEDHKHDISTAAPSGNLGAASTNDEGVATSLARSDHSHNILTATPGTIEPDAAAAEGVSASVARADHTHAIVCATPGGILPDATAQEGSATSFARSDHVHSIDCAAPGSITPDDTPLEGSSTSFARADHRHGITGFASAQGIGGGNSEGSATTFARSDHDHTIRETGDPQDLTVAAIADNRVVIRNGTALQGIHAFNPDRTVLLSKSLLGADATSIANAITLANGLGPSATNPVTIVVAPGTYTTPPFTLPAYVNLCSLGGPKSATLDASTATSALLSSAGFNSVKGLRLQGANGVGGIGIDVTGSGGLAVVDCDIDDCTTGIRLASPGAQADLRHVHVSNATDGLLVQNTTAVAQLDGFEASLCTNGVHVNASGGRVSGLGFRAPDDASYVRHVWVETSSGVFSVIDSSFREDKAFYAVGAGIGVVHASNVPGDQAYQIQAELHVGSEDRPQESAFGGGDSHTRRVAYLTNTNLEAGTWNDITSQLKDLDSSPAPLFAGTGVGNAFYVGAEQQFGGLKPALTTARVGGALILEYWNGASWVALNHMSSDSVAPYAQYAQDVFLRAAVEQVRFSPRTAWATKTLNGITKYWVRFRVSSALTTAPSADQVKVHTDRTEINADGVVEHFGAAQPVRQLIWHRGLLEGLSIGGQPSVDVAVATDLTIEAQNNRFQNGNIDGSAEFISVPPGLDTSKPLTLEVGVYKAVAGAGDVELEVDVVTVNPGDLLNGALPYTEQQNDIFAVGGFSALELIVRSYQLSLPDLVQNGSFVLAIKRDASGGNLDDTYAGDVIEIFNRIYGTFWR